MINSIFVRDLEECKRLWETFLKPQNISDMWDFRACFHRHLKHEPNFMLLEDAKGIAAMLPLSYVDDLDAFFFFPGEVWHNKTWIERTPVYLRESFELEDLLSYCPPRTYLRYMSVPDTALFPGLHVDEIGYVLYPQALDFDVTVYSKRFSNKKFKNIVNTIKGFTDSECTFHINRLRDFQFIVDMSIRHFGADSYLYDNRFREGFRDIMFFLLKNGMLRMVSLDIRGKTAAVDLGALYGDCYTVFLGGTDPQFPGIAKVINMHHIEFACEHRISKVDFLCGDFHWKKLWHMDAEPLYMFMNPENWFNENIDHKIADVFPEFTGINQNAVLQG
ncbi:conserved hypothetical protein [uncultured Desulfobacterium sp.]|uniref:BioF2-like acetyltransferase domain-containing protein n=1 Tax=uncultured Desulfobacterium sp. TaxID=201089 RepID=A0A445MU43_9BACT|nr:conserved hypothetical protein [uncultured Desulfobacterium sp.]